MFAAAVADVTNKRMRKPNSSQFFIDFLRYRLNGVSGFSFDRQG